MGVVFILQSNGEVVRVCKEELDAVHITKVDGYKVTTPHGTKAKSTTLKKAKRQARLLRGIEHAKRRGKEWKPPGKK